MSILYVVGTPIGNLSDFSPRAVETLKSVDFIAAEDTRVTVKLLNHFEIKKPLESYYAHNLKEKGEYIANRIENGESCAVVSDAGMPCISDPGEDLVRICAQRGIPVVVVPGASAAISALAISGLSTSRFTFEGFLSVNKLSREKHLDSVKNETRTMIFYEAPHKLLTTLRDMAKVFGENRRISLARELTKIHEEVKRTTFAEAIAYYEQNTPRGEFVLIIEGAPEAEQSEVTMTLDEAAEYAKKLTEDGVKPTDAAKEAAAESGYKKSEIYRILKDL